MVVLLLHIMCACLWLGFVLVEFLCEAGRGRAGFVSRALLGTPGLRDLLVQLPIFLAAVLTGGLLATGRLPTPHVTVKAATGLVATAAAIYGALRLQAPLEAGSMTCSPTSRRERRLSRPAAFMACMVAIAVGLHIGALG